MMKDTSIMMEKYLYSFEGRNHSELYWRLRKDGTLSILGNGKIKDYHKKERPWESVCQSIKAIEFQEGITGIGAGAFKDCKNLRRVKLTRNIRIIRHAAFENCCSLKEVDIPEKMEMVHVYSPKGAHSLIIERNVFRNTPWAAKTWGEFLVDENTLVEYYGSRQEVTVPDYIQEIGTFAFKDLPVTSVTLPQNLKKIGFGAFENTCITHITIPEKVISVSKCAFTGIRNPLYMTFECRWPDLEEEFVNGENVYFYGHYDSKVRRYALIHRILFMDMEETSKKFSQYMWKISFGRIRDFDKYFLNKMKAGHVVYCIGLDENGERAEQIEIFAGRYQHKNSESAGMETLFGRANHMFYQKRYVKDYPGLQELTESENSNKPVLKLLCWSDGRLKKWFHSEEYAALHGKNRHIWYVSRSKYAENQIGEYRFLKLWIEGNLIKRDLKSPEMERRDEILRRMRTLMLDPSLRKAFKKDGTVYKENQGTLQELDQKDKAEISTWEKATDCKVYYAMHNETDFGHLFTMLYVSGNDREWQAERTDLKRGYAIAYCVNRTYDEYTDVGYVRLSSSDGIVSRIG